MSDRDFRLSKDVFPARYDISLDVNLDAWRFSGRETIELTIREPVSGITLHAVELDIARATLEHENGAKLGATASFSSEAETVHLDFGRVIPPGRARLSVAFRGEIRARLRGFYRSERDGLRYAATQFEAADARRAFPCFDEPEFKARFRISLTIPADLTAISNGAIVEQEFLANGRKRITFAETPPISSYLVAYTVGPYEATPVAHTSSKIPVCVFLPRGMANKGIFARDAHVRSLEYLERYTDIPYPYGKVDAIGVPDFEAGAMENPGAITYRLTALAADPKHASIAALKGIFYTAAHELTHMWWGDLVTMAWWDDLWLNESFATFVGYKVVADLMPEWGMWRDFVSNLTRPFNLDSLVSTHPISFEVKNARQATERFDVITYWKGAAVVRMIEGFLGAETFRAGVRTYLNRFSERNATAGDFWNALSEASGRNVRPIANAWIQMPGHPLVTISTIHENGGLSLSLRQQRFFADRAAEARAGDALWPIPLLIKYGIGEEVREERYLLTDRTATLHLADAGWIFPNGDGAGFYRFALDEESLSGLIEVLQSALSPQERLSLIGNHWALTRAGYVSVAQFLRLVRGYYGEKDRAVLGAITERLAWLDLHVVPADARPGFEKFVSAFYRPHFESLGWDPCEGESADDRIRRATVIGALGNLGAAEDVRAEASARLRRYLKDRNSLDPNLASVVIQLAARSAGAALFDEYLAQKQQASRDPEEEQRFLHGLAAFENPALVERILGLVLTETVRSQDRAHLLSWLLAGRHSRFATWKFVQARWDDLVGSMDPMLQQNLVRALTQLTSEPAASEVRAFLPPRVTDETRETIEQSLEQLAIDVPVCQRLASELTTAFTVGDLGA